MWSQRRSTSCSIASPVAFWASWVFFITRHCDLRGGDGRRIDGDAVADGDRHGKAIGRSGRNFSLCPPHLKVAREVRARPSWTAGRPGR